MKIQKINKHLKQTKQDKKDVGRCWFWYNFYKESKTNK